MTYSKLRLLGRTTALASAIVGGIFLVFSTFIMRGLGELAAAEAIRAMQAINVEAETDPLLLLLLFGSALLGVATAARRCGATTAGWSVVVGGVLSMVAAIVTIVGNVPLNNHVATLDPMELTPQAARSAWAAYAAPWVLWNHVRVVAPITAAVLLALGLGHASHSAR